MSDISKVKLPDNNTYDIKDASARTAIDNIVNGTTQLPYTLIKDANDTAQNLIKLGDGLSLDANNVLSASGGGIIEIEPISAGGKWQRKDGKAWGDIKKGDILYIDGETAGATYGSMCFGASTSNENVIVLNNSGNTDHANTCTVPLRKLTYTNTHKTAAYKILLLVTGVYNGSGDTTKFYCVLLSNIESGITSQSFNTTASSKVSVPTTAEGLRQMGVALNSSWSLFSKVYVDGTETSVTQTAAFYTNGKWASLLTFESGVMPTKLTFEMFKIASGARPTAIPKYIASASSLATFVAIPFMYDANDNRFKMMPLGTSTGISSASTILVMGEWY